MDAYKYKRLCFAQDGMSASTPRGPRVFLATNFQKEERNFNPTSGTVVVCFKRLGKKKDEPYLNRLCVWATSSSADVCPGGRMSHVELMLKNGSQWYRFSIVKATRRTNEDGSYTWEPGKVHCKLVRGYDMNHYDYFSIFVPRDLQARAWYFLKSQIGAEFNTNGYMWNFVLPFSVSGTRGARDVFAEIEEDGMFDLESGADPLQYMSHKKWFCSELVCTCLQLMEVPRFSKVSACRMSPNEMYRMCVKAYGVACMNPVIESLTI